MRCEHDASVEDSGKRAAFDFHRMDCRDQNSTHDLVHDFRRYNRRWAIGSHPSGIRTLIIIEGSLMVLSDIQWHDRVAIYDRQNACLLADQTFFNDNLRARISERSLLQNCSNSGTSFCKVRADENALPRCKAISFNNEGLLFTVIQILHGLRNSAEHRECSSRNIGLFQQLLGEDFTAFQASSSGRRTEDCHAMASQFISQTSNQWSFRSHNSQVDLVFTHELDQSMHIFGCDVQILSINRSPRISWCTVNFLDERRLDQFPNQSVLTTARTDNQNLHRINCPAC